MGQPKTDNEIKAEIQALNDCKPKVRQRNFFGDDLHAAIDAQIRVLSEDMSEDDIYDEWEDPEDHAHNRNVIDNALEARAWMDGEQEDAEHDTLSAGWLDIGLG